MAVNCVLIYGTAICSIVKNIGPFAIASALRQNGYTVQVINTDYFTNTGESEILFKKALKSLISKETLWIGFSNTFINDFLTVSQLKATIKIVKSINPKTKIIMGGQNTVDVTGTNIITFDGFAEQEIVEYTKWIQNPTYKNSVKYSSKLIKADPFTAFDTSITLYEDNDIIFPDDTLPVEIARGCVFKCKFCSCPMLGKKKDEYVKTTATLYNELVRNYTKFGVTKYYLIDEVFNLDPIRIQTLYDEVFSKLPFQIEFTATLRLDLLCKYPETIPILKKSGLVNALFGMETTNVKSGKAIRKGYDTQKQLDLLKEIKKDIWSDVTISSFFILGLPYDTKESLEEFRKWIHSDDNPFDDFVLQPLSLDPNSELYNELDKYGYEITDEEISLPLLGSTIFNTHKVWRNNKTGIDFKYCQEMVDSIDNLWHYSPKRKYGHYIYLDLSYLISGYELRNTPAIDLPVHSPIVFNQRQEQYRERLSEILGIEHTK